MWLSTKNSEQSNSLRFFYSPFSKSNFILFIFTEENVFSFHSGLTLFYQIVAFSYHYTILHTMSMYGVRIGFYIGDQFVRCTKKETKNQRSDGCYAVQSYLYDARLQVNLLSEFAIQFAFHRTQTISFFAWRHSFYASGILLDFKCHFEIRGIFFPS